jgi:hypothetical protein
MDSSQKTTATRNSELSTTQSRRLFGVVLVFQGVSGAIDHLAVQSFFGAFLNFFNRFVLPRIDALAGYELLANLGLAALGTPDALTWPRLARTAAAVPLAFLLAVAHGALITRKRSRG